MLHHLKAIAVDLDGVLLRDTFSPILKQLVANYGGEYSRKLEARLFSCNQQLAAVALAETLGLPLPPEQIIADYFACRDVYLAEHDGGLLPGAAAFIDRLRRLDVRLICYGGLQEAQIDAVFAGCLPVFERYVCTNAFRPGVTQIVQQVLQLPADRVLFIDDVNRVAVAARQLGCAFIGITGDHPHPWQAEAMAQTGVRYRFDSVAAITEPLLMQIDADPRACFQPVAPGGQRLAS